MADRRLQFGWRNSPGFFCLFSAALEHAHSHTSYGDAVVMNQGSNATQHVVVTPPRASHSRAAPYPRIRLGPEFHADVSFWCLLVAGGLGSPAGCFPAPLYRSYMQPPAFTLWSDASGDPMWGYFLGPEPGSDVWWRVEFGADVRTRLRTTVKGWNDLSFNGLELLASQLRLRLTELIRQVSGLGPFFLFFVFVSGGDRGARVLRLGGLRYG